jgi:hypothetical protein
MQEAGASSASLPSSTISLGAGGFLRPCALDDKILEVARAVGLRPQADFAGYRFRQRIFERKLTIDVGSEVGSGHRHLQLVPLIAREVPRLPPRAALDHFSNTVMEGPDFVDEAVLMLVRMAANRRTGFRALGYTIE